MRKIRCEFNEVDSAEQLVDTSTPDFKHIHANHTHIHIYTQAGAHKVWVLFIYFQSLDQSRDYAYALCSDQQIFFQQATPLIVSPSPSIIKMGQTSAIVKGAWIALRSGLQTSDFFYPKYFCCSLSNTPVSCSCKLPLIVRFMGPAWSPSRADRVPYWPYEFFYKTGGLKRQFDVHQTIDWTTNTTNKCGILYPNYTHGNWVIQNCKM